MDICTKLLQDIELPLFHKASLRVERGGLRDFATETYRAMQCCVRRGVPHPGQTVAIAVGSREINHQQEIVRAVINFLLEIGAQPFIVPAMGSHGGATAQGQKEVLAGYGISEESMGIPVRSSMDTVLLGETGDGIKVYLDAQAAKADWILPINRIKPHTDFHGKHESGLAKMLAIGLGKQKGASFCHEQGFDRMPRNVAAIAAVVLEKAPVLMALGILEDCFHNTWRIVGVEPQNLLKEEAELLLEAKSLIPRLPFEKADLLVLEEIGKDISGAGMDPNVTGRSSIQGNSQPFFDKIAVLDLTDQSHGNGVGIGVADVTTRRFFNKFDPDIAYPNAITSRDPCSVRMPPVMRNDLQAVQMSLQTLSGAAALYRRVVWMRNTLSPDSFYISESLYAQAIEIDHLEVEQTQYRAVFNTKGDFSGFEPYMQQPSV